MLYVVKKDGTREIFNVEKIVNAVNKSAARILYKFSKAEIQFICEFAQEQAESLGKENIDIQDMHNIVEGALDRVTLQWQRATGITGIIKRTLSKDG